MKEKKTHVVAYEYNKPFGAMSASIADAAEHAVQVVQGLPFSRDDWSLHLLFKGTTVEVFRNDTPARLVERYYESLPRSV